MTACVLPAVIVETTTLNRQLVRMPTLRALWPKLASSSIELAAGKTLANTEPDGVVAATYLKTREVCPASARAQACKAPPCGALAPLGARNPTLSRRPRGPAAARVVRRAPAIGASTLHTPACARAASGQPAGDLLGQPAVRLPTRQAAYGRHTIGSEPVGAHDHHAADSGHPQHARPPCLPCLTQTLRCRRG